jgi:hypothetical protein
MIRIVEFRTAALLFTAMLLTIFELLLPPLRLLNRRQCLFIIGLLISQVLNDFVLGVVPVLILLDLRSEVLFQF